MANPNNISTRSEKGSYLTFEEMDLNLIELQNLINEYNSFLTTQYNPLNSTFNQIQTDWANFQVTVDDRVVLVESAIDDINDDQEAQDGRLDQLEADVVALQLGGRLTRRGAWDNASPDYSIGDVVTYTNGLDYISVSNDNLVEPSTNTDYWITLTVRSIAEFVSYDNTSTGIASSDVQGAIDSLSNELDVVADRTINEFASPEYDLNTSSFNAESGAWYSLDASTPFNITLPSTPASGDIIEFLLVAGDATENSIMVMANGNTIEGLAEDMEINTNHPRSFTMYYNGVTWRVYT